MALSFKFIVAVRVPVAAGLNVTLTTQPEFAATRADNLPRVKTGEPNRERV